jgi:hypothetical protein
MPPKLRLAFTGIHSVISQKTEFFIVTAVKTSGPTFPLLNSFRSNARSCQIQKGSWFI